MSNDRETGDSKPLPEPFEEPPDPDNLPASVDPDSIIDVDALEPVEDEPSDGSPAETRETTETQASEQSRTNTKADQPAASDQKKDSSSDERQHSAERREGTQSEAERTEQVTESDRKTRREQLRQQDRQRRQERRRGRAQKRSGSTANERERSREQQRDETASRDGERERMGRGGERDATVNIDETQREGDLPLQELERTFQILEEALTNEALGGQQLDQLLTVLERGVANPETTNPETVAELVSMLEELILEPDDLSEVDVGGFLSIFEQALVGTTGAESEDIADVFDVVEEAIQDPSSIDPADVERFRSGIERAIADFTDPSSGGFGGLFSFASLGDREYAEIDQDEPVDMFRVARIAAAMTQQATGHSVESGIRTGTRMAYAAANSESPAALLTSTRAIALDEIQRAGIDLGEDQKDWLEAHEDSLVDTRPLTIETLKERGERLLEQSAEVGRDESIHPSFPVILDQLATDEARILRLLATEGAQPVIDVIDKQYVPFRSRTVATNLTMLSSDAGCRNPKRTPLYVQNLVRLGLARIDDEPIDELKRYQILEAQAHVELARDSAKRPKSNYKRIHLTDMGVEFCELCFPFEVTVDAETERFRYEAEKNP